MTISEISARVAELLDALGDHPDAIADRLRAVEIKGQQQDACRCPIVNYLVAKADGAWTTATVGNKAAYIYRFGSGAEPVRVPLPEPVLWFIERFDRGVYLDLVADGGEA